MTDSDKLKFILILCSICLNQDVSELKSFVKVSARYVDTDDFNKILRIVLNLDFGKNSFKMMIAQVF